MTRKDALIVCRIAGYHSDSQRFVRAYVENRISYPLAMKEFRRGADMRAAGVPCGCCDCKRERGAA